MKAERAVFVSGLARSMGEARRMIKQGQVSIGSCRPECQHIPCDCQGEYGWAKLSDPMEEITSGSILKVGPGLWRCLPKIDNGAKFDQLPGTARIGSESV